MTSFKRRRCMNKDLVQKQLLQNNYVHKGCKLTAVKKSCRRINQSGSAVQSHPGSGQPGVSQTGIYCVLTRCLSSNSKMHAR